MGELLSSLHSVEGAFVQQREQYELQLRQEASTREDELRRVGQRLRAQLEAAEDQAKVSQRMAEELKHQLAQREQQEGDRIRDLTRELEALRSLVTKGFDSATKPDVAAPRQTGAAARRRRRRRRAVTLGLDHLGIDETFEITREERIHTSFGSAEYTDECY